MFNFKGVEKRYVNKCFLYKKNLITFQKMDNYFTKYNKLFFQSNVGIGF